MSPANVSDSDPGAGETLVEQLQHRRDAPFLAAVAAEGLADVEDEIGVVILDQAHQLLDRRLRGKAFDRVAALGQHLFDLHRDQRRKLLFFRERLGAHAVFVGVVKDRDGRLRAVLRCHAQR